MIILSFRSGVYANQEKAEEPDGLAFPVSIFSGSREAFPESLSEIPAGETVLSDEINFGYQKGKHWIRFTVDNPKAADHEVITHVDIIHLAHFQYAIYSNGQRTYLSPPMSWHTPLSARPVYDRYFTFPVSVPTAGTVTVLINLEGAGGILFCPVYLFSPTDFILEQQKFNLFFQNILFILSIFILTTTLFAVFQRSKVLYYFILYLLAYLVLILSVEGYLAAYTPAYFGDIRWTAFSGTIASSSSLLLMIHLINEGIGFPKPRKVYSIEKWVYGLTAVVLLMNLLLTASFLTDQISVFIDHLVSYLILFLTIWAVFKRTKNSLLFLTIILPVNIVRVIFNLILLDKIKIEWLSNFNLYYIHHSLPVYSFYILGISYVVILSRKSKEMAQRLIQTQENLIMAVETERQHIAADLHDDLGATLSILKGQAYLEKISDDLKEIIQKSVQDLRRISRNIISPELEQFGFTEAINQHLIRLEEASGINFSLISFGKPSRLNKEQEINLFRILSELTHNIVKHANASKATIQLIFYDTYLFVSVEDNGTPAVKTSPEKGMGLKNVQLRLDYLQARILQLAENGTFNFSFEIPYQTSNSPDHL